MMGHREKLKNGDEYDALTKFRRVVKYRAGQVKRIKRNFWKRVRKQNKRLDIDV